MTVRTAERRQSIRMPAAYPAVVRDRRGRTIAKGRAANISENGVYLLVRVARVAEPDETVFLELELPAVTARARRQETRIVNYSCRIVHCLEMGNLTGMGVQMLTKIC